jgi:hypothetical protein
MFFAHRLALELGWVNVDEMLDQIDEHQFRRWVAFDRICPFGHKSENEQQAVIAAVLCNLNKGVRVRPEMFMLSRMRNKKTTSADYEKTAQLEIEYAKQIAAAYNSRMR